MEGSVPKENPPTGIQSAEQPIKDLHTGVSQQLRKAGHSATPQSVNPGDQSPLEAIAGNIGDMAHVVGSTVEENLGGASSTTHVRTIEGKVPVSIAAIKQAMKNFSRLKKAA